MIVDGSILNGSPLNGSGLVQSQQNSISNITVEFENVFSGILLPTIYSTSVLYGGSGFYEGVYSDISTNNGKILVNQCKNTSIVNIEVIRFGYNYYTPFKQILYPTSKRYAIASAIVANGKISSISLIDGGSGYTVAPTVKIIGGGGKGAKITCTVSGGAVTAITLVHDGNFYTSNPVIIFDADVAVIEYSIGNIRKYPGYYDDSNSLVSDESFIQDGFYYQTYSYEIEVDELFNKYKNIVKQLLHPSGYNMFGAIAKFDIQIITSIANILSLQVDQFPIDQIFISDNDPQAFKKYFYKVLIDQIDSLSDSMFYSLLKLLEDSTSIEDDVFISRLLTFAHSVSVTDQLAKQVDKIFNDSTSSITDSINRQQNFKSVILFDSIIATNVSMSESYGTTGNIDYFAEDYLQDIDAFVSTIQ
jgi:hypothetical protein